MLDVQSLESKHRLAEVIGEMICAAEQDGEAITRRIFRELFFRHGRVTLEPVGLRHFFEPFRQFSVYGNPCSANLFVRRSDGLRLVWINDEGNVKLGIKSFSQPQQRQHRVVNGCQMSPQVEQPVSARRYLLQNLLGREGSKKLIRPIDLGFPCFQPESCIRGFVSHGSFSFQRLPFFSRRHSAPIRGDLIEPSQSAIISIRWGTRHDPPNPFQNKPALSCTLARATSTVFRASLNNLIFPFSATSREKKS